MREISCESIIQTVAEMCVEANLRLTEDVSGALHKAAACEVNPLGKQILASLEENLEIAGRENIPICQDTGMAVFFVTIGQEVHITGGSLTDAINEGVRKGYTEGYLRKSVVGDPLLRVNTKDNTPAVIHYDIVPGDSLKLNP